MAVKTLMPSETKLVAIWIFIHGGCSVVSETLLEVFNDGLL
jgi:hypothetical protein